VAQVSHFHYSGTDMFIAMNRFRIARGKENEFIEIWKKRESYLNGVPGFREFHLLQGPSHEDYTLFASHSVWESREAFEDWTLSDAFRKAHASAGSARGIYLGPPQLETFETVA
jgi:heme-degrading monooxygenase HmoA